MRAYLWRLIYAAVCFVLFWWILPLFLDVIGIPVGGALIQLVRACTAAIAVLYVLFGPEPPFPW